ncbi:MAG: PAS domain-containing protein [Nitrososphaerota archaeon]
MNTYKYFNRAEKRTIKRAKDMLGRKVQSYHSEKSIGMMNKILEAFKKGEKDVVDFWMNIDGRLMYIIYIEVRDKEGKYLGTLEVAQDIKKIEVEKRYIEL